MRKRARPPHAARRGAVLAALVLGAVAVPVISAAPCFAVGNGANQARIVIESGDDAATFCLAFDEDSLSGLDALRRTGLPIVDEEFGGGQVTVCRIAGIGCAYPSAPCFCECPVTGNCTFWGYYRATDNGEWRFSELGAAQTRVRDGDREGWRYAAHTPDGVNAPRSGGGRCLRSITDRGFLSVSVPAGGGDPVQIAITIVIVLSVLLVMGIRARRRLDAAP